MDPYREYLLSIAKPRRRIDLVPEAEWLLTSSHAQEALDVLMCLSKVALRWSSM